MNRLVRFLLLSVFMFGIGCTAVGEEERIEEPPVPQAGPIQLHPENPRLFLFRGKPRLLITSAEHYGALLNRDFDFELYLKTLGEEGMNYTRIFTGTYVEPPGAFGIEDNTLAPAQGRLIAPWKRSSEPGYRGGGNRFDLDHWDESYFERLHEFLTLADEQDVVVEITFFSSLYSNWEYSPFHPSNNINLTADLAKDQVHTLDNGEILQYQEELIRKIVREVNQYDNLFFEIQNEPYADLTRTTIPINPFLLDWREVWKNRVDLATEPSLEWQSRIVDVIVATEESLPKKHLVAQNFCNFRYPLEDIDERLDILNFHYAYPEAVEWNEGYERVIGFDESGFAGSDDATYRRQAWQFLLAGGGLFNNLDYSFTVGAEDGTAENDAPGGGSPALRRQLKILSDFLHGFNLPALSPDRRTLRLAPGVRGQLLSSTGEYALYLQGKGSTTLSLSLPSGTYRAVWVDPTSGAEQEETVQHGEGNLRLETPSFETDLALRLVRTGS